jgi:hypothetical protein
MVVVPEIPQSLSTVHSFEQGQVEAPTIGGGPRVWVTAEGIIAFGFNPRAFSPGKEKDERTRPSGSNLSVTASSAHSGSRKSRVLIESVGGGSRFAVAREARGEH